MDEHDAKMLEERGAVEAKKQLKAYKAWKKKAEKEGKDVSESWCESIEKKILNFNNLSGAGRSKEAAKVLFSIKANIQELKKIAKE